MTNEIKILIVDDEPIIRDSLHDWLVDEGYEILTAEDATKALEILKAENPVIAIVDLIMPGIDGIEFLRRAKKIQPDIEVVVMTAYASIATAIVAIKEGAYDYIEKPFSPERITLILEKLVNHRKLIEENLSLQEKLDERDKVDDIVTRSPKMRQVIELTRVVANSNATVLITGESGTGKELVARAIHSNSPRSKRSFVAVSCAALPESLLESELFGHEKGAFTGASMRRKGKIELAHNGTLFLDEIGEMSPNIQVHLLRVLEEREFTRVGGNELIKVDVRLVSATNRDLQAALRDNTFREDLYYRLNVVTIDLPPLRERTEDILLLADYFLKKFAIENMKKVTGFSKEVTEFLFKYPWPGNVRELENTIERAVILAQEEEIQLKDLLQKNSPLVVSSSGNYTLREVETRHIRDVLNDTGGNYSHAAKMLGISRVTLYNKVKKYQINVKE
ncbi:MAG: sigma-54-dependent Fis family transcriptional regulator [Dehalococcoidales bacterium]|nr:sigma-54-dependent Fis family transcriptional regulator [Dehalococcoidales bacterium]